MQHRKVKNKSPIANYASLSSSSRICISNVISTLGTTSELPSLGPSCVSRYQPCHVSGLFGCRSSVYDSDCFTPPWALPSC